MVSGCCYKEVYRYPHNNYYFSLYTTLVLAFFGSSIPTSLFIFTMFFRSCLFYAINQTLFKDHSISFKNRVHANIINNYIERTSTAHA